MSAPVNPYAAQPSVRIMASFEVEVDTMDATSLSNSSTTTLSSPLETHKVGQLAAKPDDPKDATLNDMCQEVINFTNDGPPSLNRHLTEDFFAPTVALMCSG